MDECGASRDPWSSPLLGLHINVPKIVFYTERTGQRYTGWRNIFIRGHYKRNPSRKWRDIEPSMVTHTRNSCSAFTHPSEQTPGAVGSHLGARGAVGGSCSKAPQVVLLRVERALYIHSPHLQFLPGRDSNSQSLNYEYNSLTIRPRL